MSGWDDSFDGSDENDVRIIENEIEHRSRFNPENMDVAQPPNNPQNQQQHNQQQQDNYQLHQQQQLNHQLHQQQPNNLLPRDFSDTEENMPPPEFLASFLRQDLPQRYLMRRISRRPSVRDFRRAAPTLFNLQMHMIPRRRSRLELNLGPETADPTAAPTAAPANVPPHNGVQSREPPLNPMHEMPEHPATVHINRHIPLETSARNLIHDIENIERRVQQMDQDAQQERATLSRASVVLEDILEADTTGHIDPMSADGFQRSLEQGGRDHDLELDNNLESPFPRMVSPLSPTIAVDEEDASQSQDSVAGEEPATPARRHQNLNRSLLNLLECPVCLENMEPPICQCRRGHLLCYHCRARLSACPVCRSGLSSVRNRAMEKVSEIILYPCRHGCLKELHLRHRGLHEDNCNERKHPCPLPRCGHSPMQRKALIDHLKSQHVLRTGAKHRLAVKMNKDTNCHWAVNVFNELFHIRVSLQLRTWSLVIYVTFIGPKKLASRYRYDVALVGNSLRKLFYVRSTHSDVENYKFNVTRKDCFYMSLEDATNYLRAANGKYNINQLLTFYLTIAPNDRPNPTVIPVLVPEEFDDLPISN